MTELEYVILFKNILSVEIKSVSGPNEYNKKSWNPGEIRVFMRSLYTLNSRSRKSCLSVSTYRYD
jgi:hypothetical protein